MHQPNFCSLKDIVLLKTAIIYDNIFKSQGEPDLFSLQRNHQSL
jgi:hypothetical protein